MSDEHGDERSKQPDSPTANSPAALPPAERAQRAPRPRAQSGGAQQQAADRRPDAPPHQCDCPDCREFRASRLGRELLGGAEAEECSRPEVGSIPVGSTERAREETTASASCRCCCKKCGRSAEREQLGPTGICLLCFLGILPAARWQPTAASSQQPILPPYDARYAGEHRTAAELGNVNPLDIRADDDVRWAVRMPLAADRRLLDLERLWYGSEVERGVDWVIGSDWLVASRTLRRVIAIGLSAIDVLERRDTAFTREQAANNAKAPTALKGYFGNEWDGLKYATYGDTARKTAASDIHSTPDFGGVESTTRDGGPAFYRPPGAPVSPAAKPPEPPEPLCRKCGQPATQLSPAALDGLCVSCWNAGSMQTAYCPLNAGGVCSKFCRPDPEGKTGMHMTPLRQWLDGAEVQPDNGRWVLYGWEFIPEPQPTIEERLSTIEKRVELLQRQLAGVDQ